MPPYGACDLGSLNLTQFVHQPFTSSAYLDLKDLAATASAAVRLLDNVIDASRFPLPQQADNARGSRRIGLGITGLADALVMLGLIYGGDRSLEVAENIMRVICYAAYRASIALASEKGTFSYFDKESYVSSEFIARLPGDIRAGILASGIRNSHLLAIAPTGTISLLAGNVSGGLEPIFAGSYSRKVLGEDGNTRDFVLTDCALALWRQLGGAPATIPPAFVTTHELSVGAHLEMQARLQPFIDNSISKTINIPRSNERYLTEQYASQPDLLKKWVSHDFGQHLG